MESQERHRWLLGGGGAYIGLDLSLVDSSAVVNLTEPFLRESLTSNDGSSWSAVDHIHLPQEAFCDLAWVICVENAASTSGAS
jgi:hypothetical protein